MNESLNLVDVNAQRFVCLLKHNYVGETVVRWDLKKTA